MRSTATPRKYPDELRERATRMAVEARRDPPIRARCWRGSANKGDQPGDVAELGGPGRDRRRPTRRHTSHEAARIAAVERETVSCAATSHLSWAASQFRKVLDGRGLDSLSLIHISEPTRRTPISYAVF